jgi:hypothetical protein
MKGKNVVEQKTKRKNVKREEKEKEGKYRG